MKRNSNLSLIAVCFLILLFPNIAITQDLNVFGIEVNNTWKFQGTNLINPQNTYIVAQKVVRTDSVTFSNDFHLLLMYWKSDHTEQLLSAGIRSCREI